jgi:hypothetical protein
MFKRREDGLRLKDLQLQEALIRFNKFLQENDSKRGRAEKKARTHTCTHAQAQACVCVAAVPNGYSYFLFTFMRRS